MIIMKKIIILFSLFLLTGCTVKYNININEDLKVDETIDVKEKESYFDENYEFYERKDAIDSIWENMASEYVSKGYTYTQNYNNTGINVKNTYDSFENYIQQSNIYNQYFDKINYIDNNGVISIETEGFHPYTEQDTERFAIEETEISIKIPFKVMSHNADDVFRNIYTWKIDKNTTNKIIKIKYSTIQNYNNSKNLDYFALFGIIIFVIIVGLFIYSKVKLTDNSI